MGEAYSEIGMKGEVSPTFLPGMKNSSLPLPYGAVAPAARSCLAQGSPRVAQHLQAQLRAVTFFL